MDRSTAVHRASERRQGAEGNVLLDLPRAPFLCAQLRATVWIRACVELRSRLTEAMGGGAGELAGREALSAHEEASTRAGPVTRRPDPGDQSRSVARRSTPSRSTSNTSPLPARTGDGLGPDASAEPGGLGDVGDVETVIHGVDVCVLMCSAGWLPDMGSQGPQVREESGWRERTVTRGHGVGERREVASGCLQRAHELALVRRAGIVMCVTTLLVNQPSKSDGASHIRIWVATATTPMTRRDASPGERCTNPCRLGA